MRCVAAAAEDSIGIGKIKGGTDIGGGCGAPLMARCELEKALAGGHERMRGARACHPLCVTVEAEARVRVVHAVKIGDAERFYHGVSERTAAGAHGKRSESLSEAYGVMADRTHGTVHLTAAVFVGYHDKARDAALDQHLKQYVGAGNSRLRRGNAEVIKSYRYRQNAAKIDHALKPRKRVGVGYHRRGSGRFVSARFGRYGSGGVSGFRSCIRHAGCTRLCRRCSGIRQRSVVGDCGGRITVAEKCA